jgi:hypothetical protein
LFLQSCGLLLLDDHQTQQKNSKVELPTWFWRQGTSKNKDFPSKNDSISQFSVASPAHLGFSQCAVWCHLVLLRVLLLSVTEVHLICPLKIYFPIRNDEDNIKDQVELDSFSFRQKSLFES